MVTRISACSAAARWRARSASVSRAMPIWTTSAPAASRQRAHAQMIGGDDLARPGTLAGRDQLVPRRQHGDARAPAHGHGGVTHGRRQRHLARADEPAGQEQRVAGTEVGTRCADIAAGLPRARAQDDAGAVARGVLLHDDEIRACRHRRAGRDAHRLAGADASREAVPGGRFADDGQRGREGRDIGGAHRVAVHHGRIERRLRQERRERESQRAPACRRPLNRPGRGRLHAVEHAGERLFHRQECHGVRDPPQARRATRRSVRRSSRRAGCPRCAWPCPPPSACRRW